MFSRIREDDINEVRDRTNIVDVISNYVTLKKTGRSYKGLCPFHKEKTPSFVVDAQKQLWYCFGCNEGGNAYSFLMKVEDLEFAEAVREMADRIGYTLQYEGLDKATARSRRTDKERYQEALDLSSEYYHYIFFKTDVGEMARAYVKGRGISREAALEFKIGLSLEKWDSLLQWLVKKGFKDQELIKAGLVLRGERRQQSLYDRFRNRLMFPIRDLRGSVVGFGGRIMGEGEPKYLNSPESELFHKSSLLYGLYEHKKHIADSGQAVVVEGYTDVILLHQYGIKNAVATLGTAFGESHIRLLARFCQKVVLLFDGDEAGLKAAQRALEFIDMSAADIFVAVLPDGKDPADFVTLEGPESLNDVIGAAIPVVDYCISRACEKYDGGTSQGKLKTLGEIVSILAKLERPLARDEYSRKVSQQFDVSLDALTAELKKARGERRRGSGLEKPPPAGQWSGAQFELLKAVVHYPEVGIGFIRNQEMPIGLDENITRAMGVIASFASREQDIGTARILDKIMNERIHEGLIKRLAEPMEIDEPKEYIESLWAKISADRMEQEIKVLRCKLEESDPDSPEYDRVFDELVSLEGRKRQLTT